MLIDFGVCGDFGKWAHLFWSCAIRSHTVPFSLAPQNASLLHWCSGGAGRKIAITVLQLKHLKIQGKRPQSLTHSLRSWDANLAKNPFCESNLNFRFVHSRLFSLLLRHFLPCLRLKMKHAWNWFTQKIVCCVAFQCVVCGGAVCTIYPEICFALLILWCNLRSQRKSQTIAGRQN